MSYRTLQAFNLKSNWPARWGATGTLVIGLTRSVTLDNVEYPAMAGAGGAYRSLGFHFESAISVVGGVAACASIANLPTTDTAIPAHTTLYDIYVYDEKGAMREKLSRVPFHLHESINGLTTTFTWEQWVVAQQFKQGTFQLPMIGDRVTLQAMVDAAFDSGGIAGVAVLGRIETATVPADPLHPKAVLTEDVRLAAATTGNRGTVLGTTNTSTHVSTDDTRLGATAPVVFADRYAGDFGQKITLAIAALPATGGVVDARSLTGAQSLSADVTISKHNVTIRCGNMVLSQGAFRFIITQGTRSFGYYGQGPLGSFTNPATTAGTNHLFNGSTGGAFTIGDVNGNTIAPLIQDVAIYVTSAAGTGAGIQATNTIQGHFIRNWVVTTTHAAFGIAILGGAGTTTTYAAWNELISNRVENFNTGIVFSGVASFSCNANNVWGGAVIGPGKEVVGCVGIDIQLGASNKIYGPDIENCNVGLHVGSTAKWNGSEGLNFEGYATQADTPPGYAIKVESGAEYNTFKITMVNGGANEIFRGSITNSVVPSHLWSYGADGIASYIRYTGDFGIYDEAATFPRLALTSTTSGVSAAGNSEVTINKDGTSNGGLSIWTNSGGAQFKALLIQGNNLTPENVDGAGSIGTDAKRFFSMRALTGKFEAVEAVTSAKIGTTGTLLTGVFKGTVSINPTSINGATVATQTFTLTGATVGDALILNVPAAGLTAGLLVLQSWVSAANTISITFYNSSGVSVDEPIASWNYMLIRS